MVVIRRDTLVGIKQILMIVTGGCVAAVAALGAVTWFLHTQPIHWHPGALPAALCATGVVADHGDQPAFPPTRAPASVARQWARHVQLADSFPITRTATARPNPGVRVVNFLQLNDLVARVAFDRTDSDEWQLVAATACALPAREPPPTLTTLDDATAWIRQRFPWVTSVIEAPRPVDGHSVFEVSAVSLEQRAELQAAIDRYHLNDVVIVQRTGMR